MPRQYQRTVRIRNTTMPNYAGNSVHMPLRYAQTRQTNGNWWFFNPSTYAQNVEKTMEETKNQIERLYNLRKGKSFKGFCGLYVDFQLRALGIFPSKSSFLGHGNTWYNGVSTQHVSKNYNLKKYPGANCLEDIVRDNGYSVFNIVVCFSRGRFGHVLFIHAILNGRIFFTDSFAFHNIEERKMHILSIPAFKKRYLGRGHKFIGALHFKKIKGQPS